MRERSRLDDVIIVGGGPSGTSAGLSLLKRDGIRVTLLEASEYEQQRAGESLTPGTRPLLEYLGVWQRFEQEQTLSSFGSRAAWGSSEARTLDFMLTVHGAGWSLDRVALDRMLAMVFEERGGQLERRARFLGCERSDGHWCVRLRNSEGQLETRRSRYLIDASSRRSLVAQQLGVVREKHDELVGVACIGAVPNDRIVDASILVEACEYGWWYTAPTPGQTMSTVLMSDSDTVRELGAAHGPRWSSLLGGTELTSRRVAGVQFESAPRVFRACSSRLTSVGGDGWVAVGDAAAAHDPLSSTGLPHAMGTGTQGAIVAANALFADGRALAAYQQAVQDDYLQYLQTHWSYYQREVRWPRSRFWRRRQTAVAIAPEAVVSRLASKADWRDSVHLPRRLARALCESVQSENTAHRVVERFAAAHPEVSDQRIILGLQDLVGAA